MNDEIVTADKAIAELKVRQQQRKDDLSKLKNQILDLKNVTCFRIGQSMGRGDASTQQDLRHDLDIEDGESDLDSGDEGGQPSLHSAVVLAASNKGHDDSALDRHRNKLNLLDNDSIKSVEAKGDHVKKSKKLVRHQIEVPTQSPQSISKRDKSSKKTNRGNLAHSLDHNFNKPIGSEKLTPRYDDSRDIAKSHAATAILNVCTSEIRTTEKALELSLLKEIKERLGIESHVDDDCDLLEMRPGEIKSLHSLRYIQLHLIKVFLSIM